ncbi:MAG TPA: alpha/beta fold hydrolase [Gemmatimonadaceae bacterium]|nr:alpha/beta fold hydrolase [Gemmatimonadaceae bacterium]
MNPLFFGSSDRPLYGVYHAPKARTGRRTGVVLCYPFGQEYMRSHRAFRQVAMLLAKAGFHVFRFDYRGTGDSSGDGEGFTLAGAVDDTAQAIEELQDMADVESVVLLGLRLGGAVAARAASAQDSVTHLVLWDAIADGRVYASELRASASIPALASVGGGEAGQSAFGVMGFPVPVALQRELSELRLADEAPAHPVRVLVVSDSATDEYRSLCARYTVNDTPADALIAPLPGRWDEVDNWGSAMIPQEAIQSIVGWVTSEVR